MVQTYCLLALPFFNYRQCTARSLTVCVCKQNKMKTSICLIANFWTASILQLKKLFYSFSISIAWKWIRASLSSTITRQKSGISNENSILNTLYVIFYNQKLDHFKHLTSYEPSRSKTQRHSDFWQFDYASYDRKVCDLINK